MLTDDPFNPPLELISHLKRARRVVALTGAGMSTESGIPTFRDQCTGLWARFESEMDVHLNATEGQLQAFCWLFAGLRGAAIDGTLHLGDFIGLPDLAHTWALPGPRLHLETHAVCRGRTALNAFEGTLKKLIGGGTDLARVHGVLIVLWHAPYPLLYFKNVCEIDHLGLKAIGGDGRLKRNTRSEIPWDDFAFGATLVVSIDHAAMLEGAK